MRQTFAAMVVLAPMLAACGGDSEPVKGPITIVIHDEIPYSDAYGYGRPDCHPADLNSVSLQDPSPPRIRIHDDQGKLLYDEFLPAKAPYDAADKTCKAKVAITVRRKGDVKVEILGENEEQLDEQTLAPDKRKVTFVV